MYTQDIFFVKKKKKCCDDMDYTILEEFLKFFTEKIYLEIITSIIQRFIGLF